MYIYIYIYIYALCIISEGHDAYFSVQITIKI